MTHPAFITDILLVEDNEGDIELTKTAFEIAEVSFRLSVTNDGAEAVEYLFKRGRFRDAITPRIILLDINMPRMDGMEFLKTIKQDEQLKIIPVIMLTSSSAQTDILESYRRHANSYIIKPHGINAGVDMVKKIESFWIGLSRLPG